MRYAVETLEIELSRLRRGIRRLESTPGRHDERLARLNRYVDELRHALGTLDPAHGAAHRPLEGFPEYAVETLRIEAGRLQEVIRALHATVEAEGVRFPRGRLARHRRWLAELREAVPALERALDRRMEEGVR